MRLADSLMEPVSASKASSSTFPGPRAIFSAPLTRKRKCKDKAASGFVLEFTRGKFEAGRLRWQALQLVMKRAALAAKTRVAPA